MTKRLAFLLIAFTLVFATAWALNGGVMSITNSAYAGGGVSGALQCVYAHPGDATAHPTTWKMRKSGTATWGSPRAVGAAAVKISTGSTYLDYEVQLIPTAPDTFTGTNPVLVRVYCNQLSTVTVSYQ